jgi:hypothetical protein
MKTNNDRFRRDDSPHIKLALGLAGLAAPRRRDYIESFALIFLKETALVRWAAGHSAEMGSGLNHETLQAVEWVE